MKLKNESFLFSKHWLSLTHELEPEITKVALDVLGSARELGSELSILDVLTKFVTEIGGIRRLDVLGLDGYFGTWKPSGLDNQAQNVCDSLVRITLKQLDELLAD